MMAVKLIIYVSYFWCMFVIQGRSSTCPVGNELPVSEKYKISVSTAFAISSIEHIEQREKHPCLESSIKDKIENERPFMYFPPYSASLTRGISQLLQIAQVGCYGTSCSSSCLKVRSSFQNLMYAVSRRSDIILRNTMVIIRAHRLAHGRPDIAKSIMNFVEGKQLESIQDEIRKLRDIAEEDTTLASRLHEKIIRIASEKQESLERYKQELEKIETDQKASEHNIEKYRKEIVKATTLLKTLKEQLDISKERETKLKSKESEYIACHNRQLAEKQLYQKVIAEEKKKKEAAIETKTEKCFDLRVKIGDGLRDETSDDRKALEKCAKDGLRDETSDDRKALEKCDKEKLCEDLRRQKRIRVERTEAWKNCIEQLKQLEDTKIPIKPPTPCKSWTEEQNLTDETNKVLKLHAEINSQTEKIRLSSNRIKRAQSKTDVAVPGPSKDRMKAVHEELVRNLKVAGKSSKLAQKALCVMQTILRKVKPKPSGVVSSMELNKTIEQVKALVEKSGFNWLAFAVAVNNDRKSLETVKNMHTYELTTDDKPSSEHGRAVLNNAEKNMIDTQNLIEQLGTKYGLTCSG